MKSLFLIPVVLLAGATLCPRAVAEDAPLRVLVSNGMKGSIEQLQPAMEKALSRKLSIDYSATARLKKRIEAGENFDATIITAEAIGELAKQGRLTADSKIDLGFSRLGVGIRKGAAKPDLRSEDALKRSLLAAKSVTYPMDGASREFLEGMFSKMGIAAQLQSKTQLADGSGAATASVAEGKAEQVITLFSEVIPVPGIEIAGPLPGQWHYEIAFAGAASSKSANTKAVRAMLAYLKTSSAMQVLKQKGLEPGTSRTN
jgi:molybdate transport system substrate-binding protein